MYLIQLYEISGDITLILQGQMIKIIQQNVIKLSDKHTQLFNSSAALYRE